MLSLVRMCVWLWAHAPAWNNRYKREQHAYKYYYIKLSESTDEFPIEV